MTPILLVVDLEEQYLCDDDYMSLMGEYRWDKARAQLQQRYQEVIDQIKELKQKGWIIHFTGESDPYGELAALVDHSLPWWAENKQLLTAFYPPDTPVYLAGIFRERCVQGVHWLLPQSTVIEALCISHEIIGDTGWLYSKERLGL